MNTFSYDPDSPPLHTALNGPDALHWQQAIQDEMNQLLKHDTWDLVPYPSNTNVIRSHFITRIK